jgi:radical SAM protein with 4Fe4S-binding SPASM domain
MVFNGLVRTTKNFLKRLDRESRAKTRNTFLANINQTAQAVRDRCLDESSRYLAFDYTCPTPRHFLIETGNICNLQCPFCLTGARLNKSPKGFMSLEHYQSILNKISPYAELLYLYNFGEPFLNQNIYEMIRLSATQNINTSICSNLSLAQLDHTAIVQSGLLQLSVSIDGASQKTYGKYRVGGDLELVFNNIKKLQEAKRDLHSRTPDITWNFLINKFNEHEQDAAKEIAAALGVPIQFNLMYVWDPEWESSLHPKGGQYGFLKDSAIADYAKASRGLPVALDHIVLHPNIPAVCKQVFTIMAIHWDGLVFPCGAISDERFALGNLLESNLEELWNNAHYRKCRQFLYHYGQPQGTNSVCENINCSLISKYLY